MFTVSLLLLVRTTPTPTNTPSVTVYVRFELFRQPVEEDDAPDYYSIIERPMDLDTIMTRIDQHK